MWQEKNGVIDKFLGDGILAFFAGAEDAVEAGIAIFEWAADANRARKLTGGYPLNFGLGLNSGDVCLGTIGNMDRMDTLTISQVPFLLCT